MTVLSEAAPRAASARAADEAFEALYVLYRDTLFHYLRGHCPDDDEALDLVAVTFERALIALRGAGLPEPALPWLLRVARNAAIDRFRRQRSHRALLAVLRRAPRSVAPPAESEAIRHEAEHAFRKTLAALPEAQRDALALRYGADLAIRDIAEILGKSEAAVQQLTSRGLARLRETHHDAD